MKLCLVTEFNRIVINCHYAFYDHVARPPVVTLGLGLYLASSLVNHSCDANMYQITYGTSVVFRARRPISKGEQLTYCYTKPATLYHYYERKIALSEMYKFRCRFEATHQQKVKITQFTLKMFQVFGLC